MRACFLLVLYKATYGSETLFDMFWTRRTNEFGIFKSDGRTKRSETRHFKTGHLSALPVKKEAPGSENAAIPTIYSPGTALSPESPLSRSIQQIPPPPLSVGPAIGGDWVAIPSQIFRDSCESCRKTKGLHRGERRGIKGASRRVVSDTCSHFVSWSLADWEPSFCLYSDMVPKFSHLRSYWTRLWTT